MYDCAAVFFGKRLPLKRLLHDLEAVPTSKMSGANRREEMGLTELHDVVSSLHHSQTSSTKPTLASQTPHLMAAVSRFLFRMLMAD